MYDTRYLTLEIAQLPVLLDLTACPEPARSAIAVRYAAFLVPTHEAIFTLYLRVEPGNPFLPLGRAPAMQTRIAPDGRITFESHAEAGWFDWGARQGELVLRPQGDPENFLRVVYAWLSLEAQGLLLHACGIVRRQRGYVFFGPSGSGKTTVAQLSRVHTILSDDLVIIKRQGIGYRVYGVPFRGELAGAPRVNVSAEACGVFALAHAPEHRLAPLTVSQVLARLLACAPFVLVCPANTRRVVDWCRELAAQLPVQLLCFRRDPKFWELLDVA